MSKTTKLSLIAITGFVLLAATGCQMVHVQDISGNPINWAAVTTSPQGKKTSSLPTMTNFLGDAALPNSMTKERENIQVSWQGKHEQKIRVKFMAVKQEIYYLNQVNNYENRQIHVNQPDQAAA